MSELPEDIINLAKQISSRLQFERKQREFRDSHNGVQAAHTALDELRNATKSLIEKINLRTNLKIETREYKFGTFAIFGLGPWLTLDAQWPYSNTLKDGRVDLRIYNGVPHITGATPPHKEPLKLIDLNFRFDLISEEQQGFASISGTDNTSFDVEHMAEHLLRCYLVSADRMPTNDA